MMSAARTGQDHIDFIVKDNAEVHEREAIEKGLNDFGMQTVGEERKNCCVFAYDGKILAGGLYAVRIAQGFYIKQIWVDGDYRGAGIGASLMQEAESEAGAKECKELWVDTLSYQAPDFYEKLGYREVGRIAGYRAPHDRIFFRKDIG